MRFRTTHITRYRYETPVILCHNEAHLRPRSLERQRCERSVVTIDPVPALHHPRADYFGNPVDHFRIQDPHDVLAVTAETVVDIDASRPSSMLSQSPAWEDALATLQTDSREATRLAREFVLESPLVASTPGLVAYTQPSFVSRRPLLEAVADLSRRIHDDFTYDPASTTIATPLQDVLQSRRGVCQDFAHLAIGCLRSLGVPARYVSGYVESLPPPGQPRLLGADASHAWFSVFDGDERWIDFDPTNDLVVGDRHVTVAWGRDYGDVTPLKGVIFGGGAHTLEVEVDIVRLPDSSGEALPT